MNVLITGAAGTIGTAIGKEINRRHPDWLVYGLDRVVAKNTYKQVQYQNFFHEGAEGWVNPGNLHLSTVINCAGVPFIKHTTGLTMSDFDKVFRTNVWGAIQVTTEALPDIIAAEGKVINLISDAAYRPMRCSMLYNSSKAALDMVTRCMAREWSDQPITVLGVAPNRVADTGMSREVDKLVQEVRGWSPEYAQQHQMACLPRGETDVDCLAAFIVSLVDDEFPGVEFMHGCIIPYGSSGF